MYLKGNFGVVTALCALVGCADVPDASLLEEQVAAQKMMTPASTCVEADLAISSPTGTGFVPGFIDVLHVNMDLDAGCTCNLKRIGFEVVHYEDFDGNDWTDCGDGTNPVFADVSGWSVEESSVAITEAADWGFFNASKNNCGVNAEELAYAGADLTKGLVGAHSISDTDVLELFVDTTGASSVSDDEIQLGATRLIVNCGSGEEFVDVNVPFDGFVLTF